MLLSVKKTDRLFFDTFDAMAAGAVDAAVILEEMFRDGKGGGAATYATRIKDIEHRCDGLIHELEKDGDRLYREAMARIFDSGRDPIFVIKAKEIIETLETATDAAEDIAIVLERIILKHQ